jgi:hypothetical protein
MATTSGSTAFNLDFNDIVEEAYERAGLEVRTGYEFRTARRSFNMLTIEWANRGINLWTIEQGQFVMNTGQGVYALPSDTIDLLDQVIRTQATTPNQIDINISRISESTYSTLPNKLAQGRPIQMWINRQSNQSYLSNSLVAATVLSTDTTITLDTTNGLPATGFITIDTETIYYANVSGNQLLNCSRGQYNGSTNTTAAGHAIGATVTVNNLTAVNVWPTPNAPGDQYVFVYWRMRRMQDAGGGVNIQDIPFRLIPCMVAGLAYYIGSKRNDISPDRIVMLKAIYEEQWTLAAQEDRDKAPDRYIPRQTFYR